MNNYVWAWIIVALVVIAGIWYFTSGTPTASTAGETTSGTTTDSTESGTYGAGSSPVSETIGLGSIQSLLAMDSDLICSVNQSTPALKRSGTVYVANGMMRGDFFSTTQGSSAVVSMIDDGTSLFAWNNTSPNGTKLSAATSASGSAIATQGGIDPSASINYVCHPWTPNLGFFAPPANIYFATSTGG